MIARLGTGAEDRVASTHAGVLHCGTVAVGDLSVVELQEHREGLGRLADGSEPRRHRTARVGEAVVRTSARIAAWSSVKKPPRTGTSTTRAICTG